VAGIGKVKNTQDVTENGVTRREINNDPGGGTNVTAEQYAPTGVDAHPLPGDFVVTTGTQATGGVAAVGSVDPVNAPQTAPGEIRTYARNAAGYIVSEIWQYADGTIDIHNDLVAFTLYPGGKAEIINGNGFARLEKSGQFNINGATIGTDGAIESPVSIKAPLIEAFTSLIAALFSLVGHTHTSTTPGNPTGPNLP